jgi:hypothetical protein
MFRYFDPWMLEFYDMILRLQFTVPAKEMVLAVSKEFLSISNNRTSKFPLEGESGAVYCYFLKCFRTRFLVARRLFFLQMICVSLCICSSRFLIATCEFSAPHLETGIFRRVV